MEIRLFNFPKNKQQEAVSILEQAGHTASIMTIPDIYENIKADYSLLLIFVYSDMPDGEGSSMYSLLSYRYPAAVLWMVSSSYRPEDVRAAFHNQYKNYILWSPDRKDFSRAVGELDSTQFRNSVTAERYNYRMVSFPLEKQLVTDRILSSLTDTSSTLASNYYPLLMRQSDLHDNIYYICVVRLQLPLSQHLQPDYESSHNLLIHQLKLHLETTENILSPPFIMRKIIQNSQLICLFYRNADEGNFEPDIRSYLHQVNERIKRYLGVSLLAGYSRPYTHLTDTHMHYQTIITNLDQGYFFPSQTINMLDDAQEYISFSKEIDNYIKQNLAIAISSYNCELIIQTLIEASRRFMEQKVMSTVAKTILLHTLIRFSQETDFYLLVNNEFIERRLYEVMLHMISFPLLQELFTLIGEVYTQAKKAHEQSDSNRLEIALNYIQKNYRHKISLESISKYLALTPNYFCGWFKKNTGENFGEMVIRYRIDAAKTMLVHTQKKIFDIASEVGSAEIVSFNRVFKKNVGMTPDQYRKQYSEEKI